MMLILLAASRIKPSITVAWEENVLNTLIVASSIVIC